MFIDGSDTNNFESWTTKDHFSPKFLRFFFLHNIPNKYTFADNSDKKTELLNAMQPQFFIYNKATTDNQRNFNF